MSVLSPKNICLRSLRTFIVLVALMTLMACGMISTAPPDEAQDKILTVLDQANEAYAKNDMAQAEQLYARALADRAISKAARDQAWEPYILSSLANKHPYSAFANMTHWKNEVPDSTFNNAWQRTWLKVLTYLPPYEQTRRAESTLREGNPIEQVLAQTLLTTHTATLPSNYVEIFEQFTQIYSQAPPEERAAFERAVFNALQYSPGSTLFQLLAQTNTDRDHLFPWTLVLLESLRRAQISQGLEIANLRSRINYPSLFADVSLLLKVIKAQASTQIAHPTGGLCIALALPMSGPYSPVAWKISRGASAAQAEQIAAGQQIELIIINTDQPNWLEHLSNLPPHCVAVGGPMQPSVYEAVKQRDLLKTRALFTFMSHLNGIDEGTIAWRFFSSPQDQIQTTLQFTKALGLDSYSVLAPEEPYGRRMTELFLQQFSTPPSVATYNPADSTTWNQVTSDFIGVRMVNDVPIPQSTMQAVFIPDTWENVDIMIPYILFQGEDRIVFMGTTLWEQGLNASTRNAIQSVQLAIFPGMWNSSNPSPKAAELIASMAATDQEAPDLWVGLGYDFVRLAASLKLPQNFTPDLVNHRLEQAQNMPWSMAPIQWVAGKASQQLFLFTPTRSGFEQVDLKLFSKRLQNIYARHDRRVAKAKKEAQKARK